MWCISTSIQDTIELGSVVAVDDKRVKGLVGISRDCSVEILFTYHVV